MRLTKALWDEVYQWAITNGYGFDNAGSAKASNHPVQMLAWYDMVKWCKAANIYGERQFAATRATSDFHAEKALTFEQGIAVGHAGEVIAHGAMPPVFAEAFASLLPISFGWSR